MPKVFEDSILAFETYGSLSGPFIRAPPSWHMQCSGEYGSPPGLSLLAHATLWGVRESSGPLRPGQCNAPGSTGVFRAFRAPPSCNCSSNCYAYDKRLGRHGNDWTTSHNTLIVFTGELVVVYGLIRRTTLKI